MNDFYLTRAVKAGAGLSALTAAIVAALPATALAQENTLDEIQVTAQRREESVLEVPGTVDVFSAKDIEDTGALNLADIQDFIPGFEIGSNPTQASITIRGVSSANISTGGDPSVATFYDGIYVPRAATTVSFTDLQRVEILKGPQGTLYGRNAAAGVVNMVPNRPGPDNEAFVKARFGNYELGRFELMGNYAISDDFFVRVNLLSNQRDGYLENLVPGERNGGEQDNFAGRISALWEISDRTDLQISYDADQVDNAPRPAIGLHPWAACPTDPRCGVMLNDVIDGVESRDMWAANAKINHEINDEWSLSFATGYRAFETINKQDEDGSAELDRYLDTDNIEDSDIFYSELQFNFANDRVNLVFGGNYAKEDVHQEIPVNTNADSVMRLVTGEIVRDIENTYGVPIEFLTGGVSIDHLWNPVEMSAFAALNGVAVTPEEIAFTGDLVYDLFAPMIPAPFLGPSHSGTPWSEIYYNDGDFTNWGLYGDVDFQFSDRWNLLFGLRYSNDEKTFSWRNPANTFTAIRPGIQDVVFVPIPGYLEARTGTLTASDDWDKVTGRAVVRYQLSDNSSAFLSYSTGYRSGGYDSLDVTTSDNPLRPEESENIEFGIKGDFANDRLRVQLALFSMDIEGRQRTVDSQEPGSPNPIPLVNLGDQSFDGVELVVNWLPTDALRLAFITTWRDVESVWDEFYDANGDLVPPEDRTSTGTTDTDYTVTVGWQPEISWGNLETRVDYVFNENTSFLDEFSVVDYTQYPGFYEDRRDLNARIAWTSDDDAWTVALWGKNLLDEKRLGGIRDISILLGTPFTSMDAPMSWGIELGARF
ncbi:MAG TPA: TonB-dependent receptor [Woeseiaceae bacterium]|jgi:outer membrane receptor protein involved in Fe transport|nr:TonB-dependent receptor [Woeseiaceae bacterium]